jgi:bifunctional non-homologous end joining protein LigD
MPLQRLREPFDHCDWLFELKYDGFRSLAVIERGECRLVSRNGNTFKSFGTLADRLTQAWRSGNAVLDGEIVCLDKQGRPQFYDLLYRRGEPVFYAFDLLWRDGQDIRLLPLNERKQALSAVVRRASCRSLRYVDHVEAQGVALFARACELDLEGIVAKYKFGPYTSDREASTWFKIRNGSYSHWAGRDEAFERDRHRVGLALARSRQGLFRRL